MSRSYKHTPVCCCGDSDRRTDKRIANRRVRRKTGLYQFSAYKRLYKSWLIVEWRMHRTKHCFLNKAFHECCRYNEEFDPVEVTKYWNKWYRRK